MRCDCEQEKFAMNVKEKVSRPVHLKTKDGAFLCVALSVGSPAGLFRDSAGYTMLLQQTYAAQLDAAKKMDKQLHINVVQDE